jgi:hypothetical protein
MHNINDTVVFSDSALKPISPSDVDQKLQLDFIPRLMRNKGGHSKEFLLKVFG